MPWSPLYYVDEIFQKLKEWGHTQETSTTYLTRAIMLTTKLIRQQTIKRTIQALEELGYIELKAPNVWKINYWDQKGGEA